MIKFNWLNLNYRHISPHHRSSTIRCVVYCLDQSQFYSPSVSSHSSHSADVQRSGNSSNFNCGYQSHYSTISQNPLLWRLWARWYEFPHQCVALLLFYSLFSLTIGLLDNGRLEQQMYPSSIVVVTGMVLKSTLSRHSRHTGNILISPSISQSGSNKLWLLLQILQDSTLGS